MSSTSLVVQEADVVPVPSADGILARIRPEWQAKRLIERVKRLMEVDPSSACQRLLNAAITDLRDKIVIAGLDIAKEAAEEAKLPPINRPDDVLDNYSTTHVIELAYRMGLLKRHEWSRVRRAYDIRGDLEHEDDEYEAQMEDVIYVFATCIDIVLSRDPVEILRVSDIKEFIQRPDPTSLSAECLHDYERAPASRQTKIYELLVNTALNSKESDIVRQNAVEALRSLSPLTENPVKIGLAGSVGERTKRQGLGMAEVKVAAAGGFLAYLKQVQTESFFTAQFQKFQQVGHEWQHYGQHGELLDDFEDIGGLGACPTALRSDFVRWMVLCYLGEPGGYGQWGRGRPVFYSNAAAPRIERLLKAHGDVAAVEALANDPKIKAAVADKHVARRYETLLDKLGSERS